MCEFNKDDVLILARAILEDPIEFGGNALYPTNLPDYLCIYIAIKWIIREKIFIMN